MTSRPARNGDLHLDDLLPYLMNRLVARLNQNLSEDLRKCGFTFQDWRVLAVLAAHEGTNLTELAEATVIPQPSVSRLAARLARRGYVTRQNGKTDSRHVHLFITPKGRAVYEKMRPLAVAEYRAAMKGFSAREYEDLRGALLRMMKNRKVKLLP
ncbi:MAG: MarR family winged helix-turn-helix transcriptional regulator [Pseudorhodoplanes sp.]|uniref:MarR family winged helix-turn-helix transcriptional regulator n=1 Tax=Pseudorhodoplanes sp. TaxID=1934341 RepID=UPI003D11BF71